MVKCAPSLMGCLGGGYERSGGCGGKKSMKKQFVPANPISMGSLSGVRFGAVNDRTWKGAGDEVYQIVGNEQRFKLSSPLRKGSRCEFFIDLGSNINGDELFFCRDKGGKTGGRLSSRSHGYGNSLVGD